MIFVSSVVVEWNPNIPYGIEKDASERYCLYYGKHFGLDTVIIRLNNVYGSPRHSVRSGNVIPAFLEQKRLKGKIFLSGDGSQVRDFVYYTDAVAAIVAAEHRQGITEIGTCEGHSMREVASYFDCPIEFIGRHAQDIDHQVCKKSDYETKVPFPEGMKRLLGDLGE
jgi:UDP-glucose 4-epimerase